MRLLLEKLLDNSEEALNNNAFNKEGKDSLFYTPFGVFFIINLNKGRRNLYEESISEGKWKNSRRFLSIFINIYYSCTIHPWVYE